jgi:hypothetical protein
MTAYEHLQNTLINNFENVILNKDKFSRLIMIGAVEALKADS